MHFKLLLPLPGFNPGHILEDQNGVLHLQSINQYQFNTQVMEMKIDPKSFPNYFQPLTDQDYLIKDAISFLEKNNHKVFKNGDPLFTIPQPTKPINSNPEFM